MAEMTLEQQKAVAIASARMRFAETEGGAATGNPNIQAQADTFKRDFGSMEPVLDVAGAGVLGGVLGAASKEILGGAGNVIGALPYPAARTVGGALKATSEIVGRGGRVVPAIAGAISGIGSETAGQIAEAAGAGPVVAEGARIAGGFAGAGMAEGAGKLLKAYLLTPALSVASKARKMALKAIVSKIDTSGVESLSDRERAFVDGVTKELRGGPKSDQSLLDVAGSMDDYAADKSLVSKIGAGYANKALDDVDRVANLPPATLSDTGEGLRKVITTRNAKAKEANDALYTANEEAVKKIVTAREQAGDTVDKTAEFKDLKKSLKSALEPRKRSPDVQRTYRHILSQLGEVEESVLERSLAQMEGGEIKKGVPVSFQALDDIRRHLGEVFRGKPPKGYAAIAASDARKYYAKISEIQKKYAGEAQEKLLDDYARGKEGLKQFISARGRKATALDRYKDDEFVTDAAALPTTYFKTRASVRALKELTGDDALVNKSALEFINNELSGADAATANKFMVKNRDWLAEVPRARQMVEAYAGKREVAERGVRQAEAFVKEVEAGNKGLVGGRFPADKVRRLVESGDMDLWQRAGPAIAASPRGKDNILTAVRQVIADKPMSVDAFNRTVRPALKGAGLADDAAMDLIEKKLIDLGEMKLPERERLGIGKRVVLNAIAGYTATGMARGSVEAAKFVPD